MKILCTNFTNPNEIRLVTDDEAKMYEPAFVFPVEYADKLQAVVQKRLALKKALDDSIKLVFELRNEITREKTRNETNSN